MYCFLMYQDSPKGLYKQYYLQGVEGFINFIPFNSKNIVEDKVDVYM